MSCSLSLQKWVYQVFRNPLRLVHLVRYMDLKQTVHLQACVRCRQDSEATDVLSQVMCFTGKHVGTMAKAEMNGTAACTEVCRNVRQRSRVVALCHCTATAAFGHSP